MNYLHWFSGDIKKKAMILIGCVMKKGKKKKTKNSPILGKLDK